MEVREIIENFLKENGYDGLCNLEGDPCGCKLDDFMLCGEINIDCQAGYEMPDPSGELDWLIGPTKPEPANDESEDTRI